jgi:hypothetical protein
MHPQLPQDWLYFVTEIPPIKTGLPHIILACDAPLFSTPSMFVVHGKDVSKFDNLEVLSFEQLEHSERTKLKNWFVKNKQVLFDHWNQKTSSTVLLNKITSIST